MTKILYPVGTSVQVRDWKIKELPNWQLPAVEYKVVEYRKGDPNPYRIKRVGSLSTWSFKVDEIKSYREPTEKSASVGSTQGTAQTPVDSYTKSEVDKIVNDLENRFQFDLKHTAEAFQNSLDHEVAKLHDHLFEDAVKIAQETVQDHQLSEDE